VEPENQTNARLIPQREGRIEPGGRGTRVDNISVELADNLTKPAPGMMSGQPGRVITEYPSRSHGATTANQLDIPSLKHTEAVDRIRLIAALAGGGQT
jgi:hypothetical protein